MIKQCLNCTKEFEAKSKKEIEGKNFCNHKCFTSSRRKKQHIDCLNCNSILEIDQKESNFVKFCNKQCIVDYNLNSSTKIKYILDNCSHCNQEYWRKEKGRFSKFCSSECKNKSNYKINKVTKKCLECKNEYEIHKSRIIDSKFCSVSCSSKYNSRKQGFGTIVKPEQVWNKGLTKNTDNRVLNMSLKRQETWNENYKNGKITMYFTGKKLTIQHKLNIINGMENSELNKRRLQNHPIYKSGYQEDLGHYVRSSWETNFARILNYLKREYKYEHRKFVLSDDSIYVPDFYDIKRNRFYEIKGQWTIIGFKKYYLFKKDYPNEKITLIDPKKYVKFKKKFKNKVKFE